MSAQEIYFNTITTIPKKYSNPTGVIGHIYGSIALYIR